MKLANEKSKNPFVYALRGIGKTFKSERNFKFDVLMTFFVIIMGFALRINLGEWIICLMLIGMVLFAEMINTSIEAVVDMYTREKNDLAERAKDVSAGAVLVLAIISAIVGGIIFIPKIIVIIQNIFT